jgi:excisionase family DNA binding protein
MLPSTISGLQTVDRLEAEEHGHTKGSKPGGPTAPTIFACIFVVPQDATPVLEVLRMLTSNGAFQNPVNITFADAVQPSREPDDSWLEHSAAAHYLRISKSTLYRYAEQGHIESRKLGNRLQYRRSSLDKFNDQHVRPARRPSRARGIIASALSSGN